MPCDAHMDAHLGRSHDSRETEDKFIWFTMASGDILQIAKTSFEEKFHTSPTIAVCAPGRVNLIGEHTDYNDGFVFPMVREY